MVNLWRKFMCWCDLHRGADLKPIKYNFFTKSRMYEHHCVDCNKPVVWNGSHWSSNWTGI